ncbi:MAG: AbrB/MazE/SpoVT family DNA-binding domain-containing protein [Defluviitaleaceae bacterium]|nr:AbrB/MazE/SpoVT family DNA-binding domain-containing protein [Defluviitaleaceae bacterium]
MIKIESSYIIDSRGRIRIPPIFRETFNLSIFDELKVLPDAEGFEVKVISNHVYKENEVKFMDERGSITVPKKIRLDKSFVKGDRFSVYFYNSDSCLKYRLIRRC